MVGLVTKVDCQANLTLSRRADLRGFRVPMFTLHLRRIEDRYLVAFPDFPLLIDAKGYVQLLLLLVHELMV